MFTHELKPGQTIMIGDAVITLQRKSGQTARICIDAPKDIVIKKGDFVQAKPENRRFCD